MSDYSVDFYEKEDGSRPVEEFISSLDAKLQIRVMRSIELLEDFGPELREPHSKNLKDGIFELRTKCGSTITRTLYFFCIGKKIILTNGFVKKQQKTPTREIDLAKKYRQDYLKRNGGD